MPEFPRVGYSERVVSNFARKLLDTLKTRQWSGSDIDNADVEGVCRFVYNEPSLKNEAERISTVDNKRVPLFLLYEQAIAEIKKYRHCPEVSEAEESLLTS